MSKVILITCRGYYGDTSREEFKCSMGLYRDWILGDFFSLKVLLHTIINVMYGTGLDFLVEVMVGVK